MLNVSLSEFNNFKKRHTYFGFYLELFCHLFHDLWSVFRAPNNDHSSSVSNNNNERYRCEPSLTDIKQQRWLLPEQQRE